jgi:hypothetical protein
VIEVQFVAQFMMKEGFVSGRTFPQAVSQKWVINPTTRKIIKVEALENPGGRQWLDNLKARYEAFFHDRDALKACFSDAAWKGYWRQDRTNLEARDDPNLDGKNHMECRLVEDERPLVVFDSTSTGGEQMWPVAIKYDLYPKMDGPGASGWPPIGRKEKWKVEAGDGAGLITKVITRPYVPNPPPDWFAHY